MVLRFHGEVIRIKNINLSLISRLIKQKKHRSQPDPDAAVPQKKRDGSKTLKLCYFGINESLGDVYY